MYLFLFIGLAWRMSDTVKVGPDVSCGETNVKCVSCSHEEMSTNELTSHAHALGESIMNTRKRINITSFTPCATRR